MKQKNENKTQTENKAQATAKAQGDTEAKKKSDKSFTAPDVEEKAITLGNNRSFAMSEAHKRLRTNVMFSFADDGVCRIIGVTSAMAHEGKSTTSINLSYDLMKAGKKTLLIDADMRLSKIAKLLGTNKSPGLSNMLVGTNNGENLVQNSPLQDGLNVITCGDIPPNPTELLASKRFELMLETLRESYEYIIIDLPPVSEVSDALIASKLVDGMIVVARQDFVDRRLLDDTIHQLQLGNARIIGLVMNCAHGGGRYGYKYKYKKYGYKKYGRYSSRGYGRYGYQGGYQGGYGYYAYGSYENSAENGRTDNNVGK